MFCSAIFSYPNIYFKCVYNRMVPWTPLPKYCITKLSDHLVTPTIWDTLPSLMPANITYYYGFSTPLASHYCAHKTLVLSGHNIIIIISAGLECSKQRRWREDKKCLENIQNLANSCCHLACSGCYHIHHFNCYAWLSPHNKHNLLAIAWNRQLRV